MFIFFFFLEKKVISNLPIPIQCTIFLLQLGGFLRPSSSKDKKNKSTSSAPSRSSIDQEAGFGGPNGDPFHDRVDVDAIAEYEVNERFEQMLVS